MTEKTKHTYHQHNEERPAKELLDAALEEVHAIINRQNERKYAPIMMTVPVQGSDSDVLLVDALHRALELEAACEAVLRYISSNQVYDKDAKGVLERALNK